MKNTCTGLVLCVLCLAFIPGCTHLKLPLGERHQPSPKHNVSYEDFNSFKEYIYATRNLIRDSRAGLQGDNGQEIIEGNSPFELLPPEWCEPGKEKKYKRGIVLSHGLTFSPYTMRALGQYFQGKCFYVTAVLLPGHGTRPGDLLNVTWQEWVKAVSFGTDITADLAEEVYLGGHSTGGLLSVFQSLNDNRVKGLFLYAPAIRITFFAWFANLNKPLGWIAPKSQWMTILPDEDYFKYESFPFNAAYQLYLLTQQTRDGLNKPSLDIPVFIAMSEDDLSVDADAIMDFFSKATNPLNRMVLYSANPDGIEKGRTAGTHIINSYDPERHILGSAHTALILPSDDAHYGERGDYAYCYHYFAKSNIKYEQCKKRNEDYLGEITTDNLSKGVIRRLMYNPWYDEMITAMSGFIETLPAWTKNP